MEKYAKSEVGFEHPAEGPHHCGQCEHFLGAKKQRCAIVAGVITPPDWCRKFDAKESGKDYSPLAKAME